MSDGCYLLEYRLTQRVYEVGSLSTGAPVNTVAVKLDDGPFVMGSNDGHVYLFNFTPDSDDRKQPGEVSIVHKTKVTGEVVGNAAHLSEGNLAAIGTSTGDIYLVDSEGRSISKKIGDGELSIAAMPNGKDLVVQSVADGRVYLVERGEGVLMVKELFSIGGGGGVETPPLVTQGKIVVGSKGGKVYAYDMAKGMCHKGTIGLGSCREILTLGKRRAYVSSDVLDDGSFLVATGDGEGLSGRFVRKERSCV